MRKKNSNAEFSSQRSEALLKNFRRSLATQSQITRIRAFQEAAEAPAPRFWVTESRATRVITRMMKGEDILEGMQPGKREMYKEIYRRVVEMLRRSPRMPVGDAVFEVVNSPAPSSYLGIDRVIHIITKEKTRRAASLPEQ